MNCNKCGGKVAVDDVFSQKEHVELFCLMCGKRWMIDKNGNRFGEWLIKNVKQLQP